MVGRQMEGNGWKDIDEGTNHSGFILVENVLPHKVERNVANVVDPFSVVSSLVAS